MSETRGFRDNLPRIGPVSLDQTTSLRCDSGSMFYIVCCHEPAVLSDGVYWAVATSVFALGGYTARSSLLTVNAVTGSPSSGMAERTAGLAPR